MRALLTAASFQVTRGSQVNLEIALSGVSAKVKPPTRFLSPGRKCVEASDDVINMTLTPPRQLSNGL